VPIDDVALGTLAGDRTAGLPAASRYEVILIAVVIGACAAFLSWRGGGIVGRSDFDQLWYGANAILRGVSPYDVVGPGRTFDWPYPLFYPLPGVIAALPFVVLSVTMASVVFSGVSAALLIYALSRDAPYRLAAAASFSFFFAVAVSQWSPLLIAAVLLPGLGFLLVAKPTIGFALWLYRPRWQSAAAGALLLLVSVAVQPSWPSEWLATFRAGDHIGAPITHLGGPLLVLALLRWRRPEARLLVAMACIPHTTLLYEILPLFLIPASWPQSILLAGLTWIAQAADLWFGPYPTLTDQTRTAAAVSVVLCYLPCLLMVLRRPNDGSTPMWLERTAARFRTCPVAGDTVD